MSDRLRERLADSNERFSPNEIYELFEVLSEDYGFHRDPELPARGQKIETTSMTVPGFEHFGVLVVRPRTVRDSMVAIPSLVDRILGENFQPSQQSTFNAQLIALARTVIVAPIGIVDRILESDNDDDFRFFLAFGTEYGNWISDRTKAASEKKSGVTSGIESASTSGTGETS